MRQTPEIQSPDETNSGNTKSHSSAALVIVNWRYSPAYRTTKVDPARIFKCTPVGREVLRRLTPEIQCPDEINSGNTKS